MRGREDGRMGASSSTMAVTAKTIADIHESPDRDVREIVGLFNDRVFFQLVSCHRLINISNIFFQDEKTIQTDIVCLI